jgi:GH25 family lysozyme M1 (1,4-beta-N-acetylmuramidase)
MEYIISIKVTTKWRLISNPKYEWTECRRLINTQTLRFIKKTTNGKGVKVGYYIDKRFIKYEDMVNGKLVEKIAPEDNFKNMLNSFGY